MPAIYRLASVALWALVCVCAAAAQTASTATPAELHISLGARQITFTPSGNYQELRLEIFNNSGELLYASGAVTEAELNYDLQDGNGQPLAPGLYAYTLTVKTPEAATPRAHQGHFIIEKGHDQIWLTSKDADSIGAAVTGGALTVARSPERATAGYLASGRSLSERAKLQRDLPGRAIVDEPAEAPRRLTPNISGSGTTNRLTKWLDGPNGVVADSIISEAFVGGTTTAVTIGDSSQQGRVHIFGQATGDVFAGMGVDLVNGPAFNFGYAGSSFGRSAGFFNVRPDASAAAPNPSLRFLTANVQRMIITNTGDIGIGTTTPGGVLDVMRNSPNPLIGRFWNTGTGPAQLRFVGGTGATSQFLITDTAEWLTSIAVNNSMGMQFRVRGVGTPNNEAELGNSARLTILRNGNVGIGTTTPNTKLELNAGVADASGLRFTQLTSNSPVGSGTAYLAVDAAGNVVRGATPSGGGGGAPAGSTGQIQFNSFGALGADTNLFWDNTNKRLGVGTSAPNYKLHVEGGSGTAIYGGTTGGNNSFGVWGVTTADGGAGVFGHANLTGTAGGYGVYGQATGNGGYAVQGVIPPGSSGYAGYFSGDVNVAGIFNATAKNFKIDHPLDPANKYLNHASIESSEIKNFYDGVAVLNEKGEALVELPDWFEALNSDFRYQLTCLGGYAPVYIAAEIANRQFKIAGGQPGMKVSWQVTGKRQDAYVKAHPLRVEEEKPAVERGHYQHPALYGQPEEKGLEWARNPELMRRLKQQREQAEKEKQQN